MRPNNLIKKSNHGILLILPRNNVILIKEKCYMCLINDIKQEIKKGRNLYAI